MNEQFLSMLISNTMGKEFLSEASAAEAGLAPLFRMCSSYSLFSYAKTSAAPHNANYDKRLKPLFVTKSV